MSPNKNIGIITIPPNTYEPKISYHYRYLLNSFPSSDLTTIMQSKIDKNEAVIHPNIIAIP